MKTMLVLLALLIKVSLYSQFTPVSQRFKNEEYRLFLPGHSRIVIDSLSRTDQLYKIDLIEEEDIYIIQNNALKFICDLKTGTAEVYFDGGFEGEYAIKFWDSYNFFVIRIPLARASYHFFRVYSLNKIW
jgi:hypothetical protein